MFELNITFRDVVMTCIILEIGFYLILGYVVWPQLTKRKQPPPYPMDPVLTVQRILDSLDKLDCYSFDTFFRGYFRYAPLEDIYRGNVISFLSWVLFAKKHEELCDEEKLVVVEQEKHLTERYNIKFPEGFNENVQHCCMTYEDIPYIHRPLLFYVLSGLIESCASVYFRSNGFRKLDYKGIEYWHLPGAPHDTHIPMVLFHGITSGWMSYFSLMKKIGHGREILLVDVDAIKMMSLVFELPTPEKFVVVVKDILEKHDIHQVHVVGHSFGSISAGWYCNAYPSSVRHLTLLDPVSVLLGLPDVAYSFLYRKPTKFMEYLIYYFAAMEITVSHVLRRHFWWYKNTLYLEDLPPHISIVVGLAGNDEVTNPVAVREYVENLAKDRKQFKQSNKNVHVGNVEVVYWDDYSHAQCTTCLDAIASVDDAIKRVEKFQI